MPADLSLDRLRRMQRTLLRRVAGRDPRNIVAVGFAPSARQPADHVGDDALAVPVVAQFDVRKKRQAVPEAKRIRPEETLRLLDRDRGGYDDIRLGTRVRQAGGAEPTGVVITASDRRATAAVVVRWSRRRPVPPVPKTSALGADDWRWGVLTVSHLFAHADTSGRARVTRKAVCGSGPRDLGGRVVAAGRVPGGPDVALVETGLDRLWLSGFLPRIDVDALDPAAAGDLLRWTQEGTTGRLFATAAASWRWEAYYPVLDLKGLGQLQHVIRYRWRGRAAEANKPNTPNKPFGPGTSGGVLVAGGIPIGLHIAAESPAYQVGYAQTFLASLPWLKRRLKATAFQMVQVVA
ncbi:hypothetical protein [Roseimaritima sediminicola]|uniref:hypothetical protein n=1 Tax=Roseimaritima sediminicola TaxID=2662066 RepID=UPI0012985099|nr:hypothetical protein [Roseimaritima sediminicola]